MLQPIAPVPPGGAPLCSSKQGRAAGETDGRRVRLLLLLPAWPGQGQKAHGNSTIITTHTNLTNPDNQKYSKRQVEFQIDLMKCFSFHISNKDSRTSVIKNSLICWQVMMKVSSFSPLLYKDYITGINIFISWGQWSPQIWHNVQGFLKQEGENN